MLDLFAGEGGAGARRRGRGARVESYGAQNGPEQYLTSTGTTVRLESPIDSKQVHSVTFAAPRP
eukprot:11228164-Lingulodinium_polyedra.AAC.1